MPLILRILLTPFAPNQGADACLKAKTNWAVLLAFGIAVGAATYPEHLVEMTKFAEKLPAAAQLATPQAGLIIGVFAIPTALLAYGATLSAITGGRQKLSAFLRLALIGSVTLMLIRSSLSWAGRGWIDALDPAISLWGMIIGVVAVRRIAGVSWARSVIAEIVGNLAGGVAGAAVLAAVLLTLYAIG